MIAVRDGWRSRGIWLVIVMLSFSASPWAHAGELAVEVLGAAGEPVEHAAISLHAEFTLDSPPATRTEVIDQQDRQFRPWVSAVTVGDRAVFGNSDEITHHVYSFSPTRRFSFRLQPGERHPSMIMDQSGVVVLGCNIHDWMVGYIFVSDGSHTAVTDGEGVARFTDLPSGSWQVAVWHPGLAESDRPESQLVVQRSDATSRVTFRLSSPLDESGPRKPLSESAYGAP